MLTNRIPFERWIEFVFDHPVTKPAWHFELYAETWNAAKNPSLAIQHLTRLFEAPDVLIGRFTPAQINQGLWFIAHSACSSYMPALLAPEVSWTERKRFLESMVPLYEKLFARLCTEHYGHLDRGPEEPNPVNSVCYMWWEFVPINSLAKDARMRRILQTLFARILEIPSVACRESALHGLGHWAFDDAERAREIIDAFLDKDQTLTLELVAYATSARTGDVL